MSTDEATIAAIEVGKATPSSEQEEELGPRQATVRSSEWRYRVSHG